MLKAKKESGGRFIVRFVAKLEKIDAVHEEKEAEIDKTFDILLMIALLIGSFFLYLKS